MFQRRFCLKQALTGSRLAKPVVHEWNLFTMATRHSEKVDPWLCAIDVGRFIDFFRASYFPLPIVSKLPFLRDFLNLRVRFIKFPIWRVSIAGTRKPIALLGSLSLPVLSTLLARRLKLTFTGKAFLFLRQRSAHFRLAFSARGRTCIRISPSNRHCNDTVADLDDWNW